MPTVARGRAGPAVPAGLVVTVRPEAKAPRARRPPVLARMAMMAAMVAEVEPAVVAVMVV